MRRKVVEPLGKGLGRLRDNEEKKKTILKATLGFFLSCLQDIKDFKGFLAPGVPVWFWLTPPLCECGAMVLVRDGGMRD